MKIINDSEAQLKKAIEINLRLISEGMINQEFKTDLHVLSVFDFKPTIASPSIIEKDDYLNARIIKIEKAYIRISQNEINGTSENVYYFDATFHINFIDNEFQIEISALNIFTN